MDSNSVCLGKTKVTCSTPIISALEPELKSTERAVLSGTIWTTDAPYRETKAQLKKWAYERVLAVEMQVASLFAFGVARQASVACVAMVSNAVDHFGGQFNTGSTADGL
jgi:uridine phosphorylase